MILTDLRFFIYRLNNIIYLSKDRTNQMTKTILISNNKNNVELYKLDKNYSN